MGIGSTAALLPGTCNNRHLFARHHLACATSCDGLLEDAAKNVMPREACGRQRAGLSPRLTRRCMIVWRMGFDDVS